MDEYIGIFQGKVLKNDPKRDEYTADELGEMAWSWFTAHEIGA